MKNINNTQFFKRVEKEPEGAKEILVNVYKALSEKGYNPIYQIVGYILSGDPTYITSHKNARSKISKIERDELLEELVKNYVDNNCK
ncbi:MAG: IreB family regulatory phosphoprotein [Vallitalea sp.]|nr:IreB family regulatory phosphoprotein [Vallitalea sp.]